MLKQKNSKLSSSREISLSLNSRKSSNAALTKKKSKLTKEDKKGVKLFFGAKSKKVMELLEIGDTDSGMAMLKKTLLITVVRALPASEKMLVESGNARGVYQFNQLISQIRELITDIQADGDRKFLARSLMESIMKPAFMDLAQDVINDHHTFRKESSRYVKSERAQDFSADLQNLAMNLAAKMNKVYAGVGSKLEEALKS